MNHNYHRVLKNLSRKSVLIFLLFLAVANTFGQSPFVGIPGLALWLRADKGVDTTTGGFVTTWHDQSGFGNDAVAPLDSQPKVITAPTLNNMPSLLFNGTTNYFSGRQMAAFNNNGASCGTYLFLVCKGNTPQNSGATGLFTIGPQLPGLLWERSSGLGDLFVSNSQADQTNDYVFSSSASGIPSAGAVFPYRIFEVRKTEGSGVGLYANTVSLASRSNAAMDGPFTNSTYNIGWAQGTGNYFNGEIAELLVFISDTCLNGGQLAQIESYLGTKYSPHVYIGPRDTTITHGLCALPLTAPSGFASYLWSTGATTNSISVSTSGTYSVIIKDAFGALQYDTSTVTFPNISLNHTATLCQGGSVELVPIVPSFNNYTFKWTGGLTTDSISVSAAGNYSVTVTDALNTSCSVVSNAETVSVDAFRSTLSLGSATTICAGNKISLVTPSAGWNRLRFQWTDGSTDSLLWVNTSGTYSVTVTDTIGCSGTASVNITVANTAPHVNFTTTPVCQGLPYTPYNNSDSVNVRYAWTFGDGGSDTARFPSHLYHAAGTFPVHLTVTNTVTGCLKDTIIPVTINALPGAGFQGAIACTGFIFTFNNISTPAPGQTISNYSWNFGDINNPLTDTSSQQTPSHLYTVVDTYLVTLVVTQPNGCTATAVNPIIVESPASAPAAPVLTIPADSSISASNTITFGWLTAAGAAYYELYISTDPSFATGDSVYNNIFSNQKTVTLPPNQTYYWKVFAVNPCGTANSSLVNSVVLFDPSSLGNIAFWVKADSGVVSNNGNVSVWRDISAGHDSATAAGSAQPTLIQQVPLLNYKPSLKFGNTSVMTGNAISALGGNGVTCQNSLSIFIIARADGPLPSGEPGGIFTIGGLNSGMWIERGNGFAFINYYNNNQASNASTNPPVLAIPNAMPNNACPYHLYGVTKNIGSYARIDTNGVFGLANYNNFTINSFIDSAYSIGHPAGTDPYGGNGPYGYLNGEIAEIIIYNTLLTPAQTDQVNQYLFNKYAPPVNLGPDITQTYSLCPVTLKTGKRFVSYKWNTGATSDSLNVTQSGQYSVTCVDVFNHISSDSIIVTLPYQGSNPDTDYVCHGDTGNIIQLINQPQSYTYAWYYSATPNGTFSTLNINADAIRPYLGGYYYTTITDTSHCSIVTPKVPVIIDNFYSAQLLPTFDTLCRNGTLVINPTTYVIDSFLWIPLNDTTSAPYIPASGMYYLYTSDNHNCKNIDSSDITTRALAPVTNFTVPNYCLSNTTYFIDSTFAASGDSITSYNWNYGGGIPSTDTTVNGQTSYRINYGYGNYTVTLKVTTDSGCVGIKTRHITILPSPNAGYLDSANNSLYPYILCAGASSSAQFTDTSQEVGNSPITQRFWKFNGVVNSNTSQTVQYSFPQQGVYAVTLEVVNSIGCADSITRQIAVNPAFTADFTYADQCLGDKTTFTDLTHSFSVVSRIWKFRENGDGPYAYTPTAQLAFAQPGTYDVELQLVNALGCISTVDKEVKIVQKPVANFTNLISCIGQPYSPHDSSFTFTDTLVHWNWNIGGTISHSPSPVLTFHNTGPENVSLKVVSSEGCVDSIAKTIYVAPVPTALFAFNPLYGTAPLQVNFSNRSSGATSFTWYFGDGNSVITDSPYINPPPHVYNQNGNYDIVLYAYNQYGCYDSLSRLLTVIPTDLDIAIEQVGTISVTQPDGSQLVTLTAFVSNVGTRIITSAQLYATLGGSGIMEQNWSGYLLSGQTVLDTFPAQFVVPAGAGNTYVCVSARDVNNGQTEIDTTNNQNCASLTSTMQLAGPQPNPAITSSLLGIILPQAGTVYVSIYDELGRPIVPEKPYNLPVGRTNYILPVSQLQGAEYFIRVRYNDDTQIRKFVVK
jgi:PKD repeat protein